MPHKPTPHQNKNQDFIFYRRTRSKQHFVTTSKVLLWGYKMLSDGAKITYQVLDGYDWEDATTGDCKGYVYPAVETLAEIRGLSSRTIERHIAELEKAKLLTRQPRRNLPSLLIIEDIAVEEEQAYFDQLVRGGHTKPRTASVQERSLTQPKRGEGRQVTKDKNVVRGEQRGTTKMSLAYKDEITRREEEQQRVVVEKLKEVGVSKERAEQLGQRYPAGYVEQKILLLEWKLRETRRGHLIADAAAWLVQAIVQDYQVPAEFHTQAPRRQTKIVAFDSETNTVTVEEAISEHFTALAPEQGRRSCELTSAA